MNGSRLVLVAVAAALSTACASARTTANPEFAKSAFEQMKSLSGRWVPAPGAQMAAPVEFRVIGSGSAVHETLFPGTPYEMVSVYHMDGDRLVMTHYCSSGNQPRFEAVPGANPGSIKFEFRGLSNGDPAKDSHMHEGISTLGADGRLHADWTGWDGGKPDPEHHVVLEWVRAK